MRFLWNLPRHLVLLFVLLITASFEPALALNFDALPATTITDETGPETGGGGNGVMINGQLLLLDFFNYQDANQVSNFVEFKHSQTMTDLLGYSYAGAGINVRNSSQINSSLTSFNYYAESLLKMWGLASDRQVNPFQNKLKFLTPEQLRINWSFVNRIDSDSRFYFYSPRFLPASSQIEKAAYYSVQRREVRLSHLAWANFNFSSRIGLVVHEKLRQLQLTFGYIMDDQLLQKSTLMMLICKPDPALLFRILTPRNQELFGQQKSLSLYTEHLRIVNSMMDQGLSECSLKAGLSYQP